jgi:predicted nucleic acid-binding Zn ribbon protein
MTEPTEIVCLYTGPVDECVECGGGNETGTQFCSTGCEADFADRRRRRQQEIDQRRGADDAFAQAIARLREREPDITDEEIDDRLRWMP